MTDEPRSPAAIRQDFARRLQNKLNDKGWTQAELARRMVPLLKDSRVGRDNISKYVRGKVLPLPPHLEAMAKVLESGEQRAADVARNAGRRRAAAKIPSPGKRPSVGRDKSLQPRVTLRDSSDANQYCEGRRTAAPTLMPLAAVAARARSSAAGGCCTPTARARRHALINS